MVSEAAEARSHDFAERISKLKAGCQTSLFPAAYFLISSRSSELLLVVCSTRLLLEFLADSYTSQGRTPSEEITTIYLNDIYTKQYICN